MIRTELACRLRLRGLTLPPDKEYQNPKIKELVVREYNLLKELDKIDAEFWEIARTEGYGDSWVAERSFEQVE